MNHSFSIQKQLIKSDLDYTIVFSEINLSSDCGILTTTATTKISQGQTENRLRRRCF